SFFQLLAAHDIHKLKKQGDVKRSLFYRSLQPLELIMASFFPHVYGVINVDAIVDVVTLPKENGEFILL
ncbi:hypothetical protein P5774_26750, partial [Bacillus tropicus]|nr:hypothetical protein [Bacillus tropicus]